MAAYDTIGPGLRYPVPPIPAPSVNTAGGFQVPHPTAAPAYKPWEQDPGYVAAVNAQKARDAQAAAALNQQRSTALYGFSGAGNPYATTALLKQQDADATRAYMNSLAARGILNSGETGYQAGQESKRYGLSLYEARRALDAALNGYQQQYVNQTNADAEGVTNATLTGYQNYLANPALYPAPPAATYAVPKPTGTWNPGVSLGGLLK